MAEPDNLVLSILREIRGEIAEFREEVATRLTVVEQRLDGVETKTDGLTLLLASAFGNLSHEIAELRARVDRLDPVRT